MKKLFYILTFYSIISVSAQDSTKHYLGFHAGTTSSLGISYRFWPKRLGVEITFTPQKNENYEYLHYALHIGTSGLLMIKHGKYFGLYVYLSNYYRIAENTFHPSEQYTTTTKHSQYNIGSGLGVKIDFLKELDFNLQFGYGIYNVTSKTKKHYNYTGEIGLYYHL